MKKVETLNCPPVVSLPKGLERSLEIAQRNGERKCEGDWVVPDLYMVKSWPNSKQILMSSAQWEVEEKVVHSKDSHHREDLRLNHYILLLALSQISGSAAKSHAWLADSKPLLGLGLVSEALRHSTWVGVLGRHHWEMGS